jgi:ABC-type branched-subunit amino acid transport system substrate-binding protein
VYTPWQLATSAQTFGQALKEQGKNAPLFGSDGLFDPTSLTINGTYISFWGTVKNKKLLAGFVKKYGGPQFFGAPTFIAAWVEALAIEKACKDGKVSRGEVRALIAKSFIPAAQSLSGNSVRFKRNGDLATQTFYIYKIVGGSYIPVA